MLVLTDFLWYYVPLGFCVRRRFYVPVFSFFACLIALWLELVGCYYRFVFYLFFVILGRDVRVRMNNLATTGAWENYYLVVVAVQGPPLICL